MFSWLVCADSSAVRSWVWTGQSGRRLRHLVVQHHHVARVSVQPRVDGLAHAADLVQRRRVVVRPAEFQNLGGGLLGDVGSRFVYDPPGRFTCLCLSLSNGGDEAAEVFVPCGLASRGRSSGRSG